MTAGRGAPTSEIAQTNGILKTSLSLGRFLKAHEYFKLPKKAWND